MTKQIIVVLALFSTPVLAGPHSKPQSARTQAHADRASKDAGKADNANLAASRQKLADQRQKAADRQRKNETAKAKK